MYDLYSRADYEGMHTLFEYPSATVIVEGKLYYLEYFPSSTVKFLKSAIKGKQKFSEASKGRQNKRTLLSHDLRLLL